MWLLYIVKTVPKDTGFLLGAFGTLADMLDVRVLTTAKGKSVRGGLVKQEGLKKLKLMRDQALVEAAKRRKVLEAYRRQNQRRIKDREEERNTEGVRTDASDQERFDQEGGDGGLSRREYYEQQHLDRIRRRAAKLQFRKNRTAYLRLKKKIAKIQKKIKMIQERRRQVRRATRRSRRESIDFTRARYRTINTPIVYTNTERIKARLKKIKLPEFTTHRERIRPGDPDSFRSIYRKYYYPGRGGGRGPLKTPTSGQRYATNEQEIFQEKSQPPKFAKGREYEEIGQEGRNLTFARTSGKGKSDDTQLTYGFTYDVEIAYYKIMDFLGRYKNHGKTMRPPGTPWFSQRYAEQAFKAYLERELPKRIPVFTDYTVKWKSTLNKNGAVTRGFK